MTLTMRNSIGLLILAGGRAARLQELLEGRSKALIHFSPWPPMLLDLVRRAGRRRMEVCIATDANSYSPIDSYILEHGQHAQISIDPGLGTGYAIKIALERMQSSVVIVCNADTIIPFDIIRFGSEASSPYLPARQILTPLSIQNSGLIGVSRETDPQQVVHWGETTGTYPVATNLAASSSGAYIVQRKQWLANVDSGMGSLENAIMPALVNERAVEAYVVRTLLPTYDFGTPDRISVLGRNRTLLNQLLLASGADHPVGIGHCLTGVQVA